MAADKGGPVRHLPIHIVAASARRQGLWPVFAGCALGALTVAVTWLGHPTLNTVMTLVFGLMTLALMVAPSFAAAATKRVLAIVRPGHLEADVLTLSASEVLAATTARSDEGISIAIHSRSFLGPVILEVGDEKAAVKVVEALGAGESGAGSGMPFRRVHPSSVSLDQVLSAAAVFVAYVVGAAAAAVALGKAPSALAIGLPVPLALAVLLARVRARHEVVVLGRRALTLEDGRSIAYDEIRAVSTEARALRLDLAHGRQVQLDFPIVNPETQHFAYHLRAAVDRAHGPPVLHKDAPALLAAPRPAPEWLAELDAAADRNDQSGYRDRVLDADDVEAVLRDADRSIVVRAAAARLLLKLGGDRTRVEETLATFRGEGATERARVVAGLDSSEREQAAAALEDLEALADAEEEAAKVM